MPSPRVFVSSTCYDLRYIRENLRNFIQSLGYEPILSEEGSVYFDPKLHTHDACVAEVGSCQMLVLIIGGRYGSGFKDTRKSITNAEYQKAVAAKVPIFALVEREVLEQYQVYKSNKANSKVNLASIEFPAVDSTRIFEFVEEVQGCSVNNALVSFSGYEELKSYLKQQWASMLYRLLTSETEAKRVGSMMDSLSLATTKLEFMTRQLANATADTGTRLTIQFYDFMLGFSVTHDLGVWKLKPSPKDIIRGQTLDNYCGGNIQAQDDEEEPSASSMIYGGPPFKASSVRLAEMRKGFKDMRVGILAQLTKAGMSMEDYLARADQGIVSTEPNKDEPS